MHKNIRPETVILLADDDSAIGLAFLIEMAVKMLGSVLQDNAAAMF